MKSIITTALLLSSLATVAETISLKLPEAGRYIITLQSPSSCMSSQYAIVPGQISWSEKQTVLLKATVSRVVETRGGAQWCDGRLNVATGVVIVGESMELEINLDGAEGELTSPEIRVENVSIK